MTNLIINLSVGAGGVVNPQSLYFTFSNYVASQVGNDQYENFALTTTVVDNVVITETESTYSYHYGYYTFDGGYTQHDSSDGSGSQTTSITIAGSSNILQALPAFQTAD